MNKVNVINLNVAVVENVTEMESVDVMAGAGAATSGRPLIEVIDEGQVDLSSDGIVFCRLFFLFITHPYLLRSSPRLC